MRFDRLDLNLLIALDALIEAGSVTGAARRLNLSQPTVTGALKRLRDFFDDELLTQSGRQMFLTAKAIELAGPLRAILNQIRSDITRPGRFDPATSKRRFSISTSDYAFTILIAQTIARAERIAPGVSFEIIAPSNEALERLERAEIDLFIVFKQFVLPDHPRIDLWRDEEVVISWQGAGYSEIDADVYYDAGHVIARFDHFDRERPAHDAILDQPGRRRRVELVVPDFSALPHAVIGTRRLAVMHRLYAEHFSRFYPIRLHPSWTPLPEIVETAQWHRARSEDPGIRWLSDLVREEVRGLPAFTRVADARSWSLDP